VRLILLLLLCLFNFLSVDFAQSLQGLIVDQNGNALSAVLIRNASKKESVFSDKNGQFSIAASLGDSIEFSILGYDNLTVIMPEDGTVFRRVFMHENPFALKEVEIHPDWTPYQLDSIERRKTYQIPLDRRKEGSILSPVTAIAENISRKSRQRWKFQKNFSRWEDQKFIDTRYSFKEVSTLTGLKGDSLAAFIHAYPMPVDYARYASDLEIKMWIKYNYRQWIKHPTVPKIPDLKFEDSAASR